MQLPYTEGRAVRMLIALLAAADPLGRVEAGHRPDSYEPLATAMLATLRNGGRKQQIVATLAAQAPGGALDGPHIWAANAFVAATLDWWASTERLMGLPLAS